MKTDAPMPTLREANPVAAPASARDREDRALFAAIIAAPGDPRLAVPGDPRRARAAAPRRRRRLPRRRYLVALAALAALGVGTAWGASGDGPLALFSANPQEGAASAPGSPWHQTVIPTSVHAAASVDVPGVGTATLWYARTRQKGFCTAIRLPDGSWAGTLQSPVDDGGAVPGCQPTREQINGTDSGEPVYGIDGFDYEEADLQGGDGNWRLYFGEVEGTPQPVRILDRVSGREVAVSEGHLFLLAVPDADPDRINGLRFAAFDGAGNVVAETPGEG
jgi:hypothetical protein